MTQDLKDEALEQIEMDIRFGFEKPDQLFDNILDMFYTEKSFDKRWLRETLNEKYQAHQQESLHWSRPNDFDRLANAFDNLIAQGIVCLHKAGYTKQDAIGDCGDTIARLRDLGVEARGFCYYHTQDLVRAIAPENPNLFLGFDSLDQNDEKAVEIGQTITQTLREHKFQVRWPGTIADRIEINPICWQKVPDGQDWGAERVIRILTQGQPPKKPFWKFW